MKPPMFNRASCPKPICWRFCKFFWLVFFFMPNIAQSTILQVPSQFPTIQSAIDTANNGDEIVIATGVYSELLMINKAITLTGTGMGQSIIHFNSQSSPIVSVDGAALMAQDSIVFRDLTITGGVFLPPDIFYDVSAEGILATNANIKLQRVSFNFISNYCFTIEGGSLHAEDVQLFPDFLNYTFQCDIGINIKNSVAYVTDLLQTRGNIDHTIDVNNYIDNPDILFSDVVVNQCTIRSSALSWGECIRTYGRSHLLVEQCSLYRVSGGQASHVQGHSGVGVNGPYANVWVDNTIFDGLPWGIQIHGSIINSNRIIIGNSQIMNSEVGGIQVRNSNYNVLDIGRGNFGSPGFNQFSNNNQQDVILMNSTGDIYAGNNSWSNNTNPDTEIYDQLDDSSLGRVLHNMTCQPAYSSANGNALVDWILGNGNYVTNGVIESTQTIKSNSSMIYNSGTSISLNNEFYVERGAVFETLNNGCGN